MEILVGLFISFIIGSAFYIAWAYRIQSQLNNDRDTNERLKKLSWDK